MDRGAPGRELAEAFSDESRAGLRLAVRGRAFALFAIAALLPLIAPFPDLLYYHGLLALLLLIGFAQSRQARDRDGSVPALYFLFSLDFVVLCFGLIYPNPIGDATEIDQGFVSDSNFKYFYVFLAVVALTYKPRLVLWCGLVGAASWLIGITWLFVSLTGEGAMAAGGSAEALFPDPGEWFESRAEEAVVFLMVASLLALAVERSRRLLINQVDLARERNNLARYFPPSMVETLSGDGESFSRGRETVVSVLFADLVGFTQWAERRSSDQIIALLREVHARLEGAIFEHGGTLDKFIGDGVMATFGTPHRGPDDAANALRCAFHVIADFERWNAERRAAGQEPLPVSIGIHTGPVVIGDIGSDRRLELAVLGDSVNLASRLESLTRSLGCRIVVSDVTRAAVRDALPATEAEALLAGLTPRGLQPIRGREKGIEVWTA